MIKQCPGCGQWKEQGTVMHIQERITPYRILNHFLCVDCEKELRKWFNERKECKDESESILAGR